MANLNGYWNFESNFAWWIDSKLKFRINLLLTWVVFTFLQTISYMAERVVGTGSFGIVFQVYEMISLAYLIFAIPENTIYLLECGFILACSFAGKVLGNWGDCCHQEGLAGQTVQESRVTIDALNGSFQCYIFEALLLLYH